MDSTADRELEMIRADAHQTRANLAGKLEALESQVSQTVAGVTSAVENVTSTVSGVAESVTGTVSAVTDSVAGTVNNLTESVAGAAQTVKETFEVPVHAVENHPWAAVGIAVAVGVAGGMLMGGSRRSSRGGWFGPALGAPQPAEGRWTAPSVASYQPADARGTANGASSGDSTVNAVGGAVGESVGEIGGAVQSLGISALMGVVSHLAKQVVPEAMQQDVCSSLNKLKTRLGGRHDVNLEAFFNK